MEELDMPPGRKLLLLVWAMRYEWLACAVTCYFIIFGETFRDVCIAIAGWVITWALQFVRPAT